MTRNAILNTVRLTPGGDQRDRDRAKAQKKQAEASKGKSQSQKEKEAYVSPWSLKVTVI
jgi:hypothetical protein